MSFWQILLVVWYVFMPYKLNQYISKRMKM